MESAAEIETTSLEKKIQITQGVLAHLKQISRSVGLVDELNFCFLFGKINESGVIVFDEAKCRSDLISGYKDESLTTEEKTLLALRRELIIPRRVICSVGICPTINSENTIEQLIEENYIECFRMKRKLRNINQTSGSNPMFAFVGIDFINRNDVIRLFTVDDTGILGANDVEIIEGNSTDKKYFEVIKRKKRGRG